MSAWRQTAFGVPVKHAVENGATDGEFGLPTRPRPGSQTPPYDGLVSPDYRFHQQEFAAAVETCHFT
ncbi:hypothetical protein HFN72_26620 [Rhizobium laguerreae]|nr:hypothetical protein [Rhizobium laguerreae]MBY3529495.1 hypothetical protein [Rhizobium laguerreae]